MVQIHGRSQFQTSAGGISGVVLCLQMLFDGIYGQYRVSEGDVCFLPSGREGQCLDQTLCPALLAASDEIPVLCGYHGRNPLVCCPSTNVNLEHQQRSNSRFDDRPIKGQVMQDERPMSSQVVQGDRLMSGQVVQDDRPMRGQVMQDDSPMSGQVVQDDSPMSGQVVQDDSPMSGQVVQDDSPMSGQVMQDDRPMSGQAVQNNRPTSGQVLQDDRPMSGQVVQDDRPMSGQVVQDDRPMSGQVMQDDRFMNGQVVQNDRFKTTSRPQTTITAAGAKRSKAEIMCDDVYAKLLQQTFTAFALTMTLMPVNVSLEKCNFEDVPLIVGGNKTRLGEFPHMAAIGYTDSDANNIDYDCGGSLISDYFVLTAAHCITPERKPVVVRLGAMNITAKLEASQPLNFNIADIIIHPDHKTTARYNDIALLRLAKQVTFTKYIRPACLYTKAVEGEKAIATGWGKIDFAEDKSDILLKVHISIIDSKTCNTLYNYDRENGGQLKQGIVGSQLCAGELKGGKDTCEGDSGGPLQISGKNPCLYYIIGITSFGKFCAAQNSPGVYTKVSYYVPWIESVVWP